MARARGPVLLLGWLCSLAVAQDGTPPPKEQDAARWVTQLELPRQRQHAMERLCALGPVAVARLRAALDDPRAEIRIVALRTLGLLGPVAAPALERVTELADSGDATEALAAASAAGTIRGGRGHLLVVDFGEDRLVELDDQGEIRAEVAALPGLRAGSRLDNGHFLVAVRDGVQEITTQGKKVWSYPVPLPNDAERLANGHTLIASATARRVVEVDGAGKVVWKFTDMTPDFRPVSCQRLPNGHTLIADYPLENVDDGRVIEVDEGGEIVWQLDCRQPAYVRRLTGDRTLIVAHKPGRVQIVDRDGHVLHSLVDVGVPSGAAWLANGHLLVAGEGYVCEFDAEGKRLWRRSASWAVGVQRH